MKKILIFFALTTTLNLISSDQKHPSPKRTSPAHKIIPQDNKCDQCIKTTNGIICCVPKMCYFAYLLCCKKPF